MFELNRPLEEIVRVAELPLDEVLQLKAEFAGMAQS
jgi:HAMP domain-containing protein